MMKKSRKVTQKFKAPSIDAINVRVQAAADTSNLIQKAYIQLIEGIGYVFDSVSQYSDIPAGGEHVLSVYPRFYHCVTFEDYALVRSIAA